METQGALPEELPPVNAWAEQLARMEEDEWKKQHKFRVIKFSGKSKKPLHRKRRGGGRKTLVGKGRVNG